jgi:hypothetical protein
MERFSSIRAAEIFNLWRVFTILANIGFPKAKMNPTPSDWQRLSSSVFYQDAAAAIDWLCEVFRFAVRLKVAGADGRIEHSELT